MSGGVCSQAHLEKMLRVSREEHSAELAALRAENEVLKEQVARLHLLAFDTMARLYKPLSMTSLQSSCP